MPFRLLISWVDAGLGALSLLRLSNKASGNPRRQPPWFGETLSENLDPEAGAASNHMRQA